MASERLIQAVAVTAELCGASFSDVAKAAIVAKLEVYDERAVIKALDRCQTELKGRFTLAEILSRIDDGRPSGAVAWAQLAWNEESTAVITIETRDAQNAAWAAYSAGDKAGARQAFLQAYEGYVTEARAEQRPVVWWVSAGTDRRARESAVQQAVNEGKISMAAARCDFPGVQTPPNKAAIEARRSDDVPCPPEIRKQLQGLIRK